MLLNIARSEPKVPLAVGGRGRKVDETFQSATILRSDPLLKRSLLRGMAVGDSSVPKMPLACGDRGQEVDETSYSATI